MKADIHPQYFPKSGVKCACGNSFTVGSTKEFIETEICAKCHPFYTKQEKVIDTLGRVQKFKEKMSKISDKPKKVKKSKERKK
jgi:large subunit ribosomal protein L31